MKSRLMIAVAGLALLSAAACNRPAEDTAAETPAMAADDSAADASAMAPADGAMAPSAGATTPDAAAPQAMAPEAPAASGVPAPAAGATPTTQETIEATRDTLSPAGASSGATAPSPQ